jgi:hypothetical protein
MSKWHTARRLLASGEPMWSCADSLACGWAGGESELAEWGGEEGKCPRCGADLEEERPASGLATIGEVARAMADMDETAELAAEVAALGGPADLGGVDPEGWLRVDALFGRMPDPVEVWRAVGLPEGEALDEGSIGMCWAWDSRAARAHNAPAGVGEVTVVVAHGTVAKADVDWPETFALNILLPDEREIRLKPGAGVRLLDVDGRRVNRRVTAENRLGQSAIGRRGSPASRSPTVPACRRSRPG